jgi:hypothetical protein
MGPFERNEGPFTSAPTFRILNYPKNGLSECVYEFRSGRLIRGVLVANGDFVPETGAKVITLNEYVFGIDAHRIYNLPGFFVAKKEARIINPAGNVIIARAKRGTPMQAVDDFLGAKVRIPRNDRSPAVRYYYTRYDIVVEFDDDDKVTRSYSQDLTKRLGPIATALNW